MKVTTFLEHYNIRENPFLAEEARQDQVFARLHESSEHPDFPKILGDLSRPATAVVFGEKGSGKTALRMQIARAVEEANRQRPDAKTLVIAYDDLNPILDRFVRRVRGKNPQEALEKLRLVDHVDGLLGLVVPDLVSAALGDRSDSSDDAERLVPKPADLRKLDPDQKLDWLLLQAIYDRGEAAADRSRQLRLQLRYFKPSWIRPTRWLTWILILAVCATSIAYWAFFRESGFGLGWVAFGALAVLTVLSCIQSFGDWWLIRRIARRLHGQLRVVDRSVDSFRSVLERFKRGVLRTEAIPIDDLDDPRYSMLERLFRVVGDQGYQHVMVLVDRVDEPTLINGDTARMKAVIWPLFNNKLLQQGRLCFKMLLPVELRHEMHRMTSDFFQEARMDKANLIDRLTWSGTTLYDLCSTRLNACLDAGSEKLSLTELFEEGVTRQEIVDALDQMRQPRDAFKMMYQLIQEHCQSTTDEEEAWRIPKLTLDKVKRSQAERLEALQRGLGPA